MGLRFLFRNGVVIGSEETPDPVLDPPRPVWSGRGVLIELDQALVGTYVERDVIPAFRFLLCDGSGARQLLGDALDVPANVQPWDYALKLAADRGYPDEVAASAGILFRLIGTVWTAWDRRVCMACHSICGVDL